MFLIVWEYRVKPGQESAFWRAYGPGGEWVRFFRQGPGYFSTELLRDASEERRYLTIDRWSSRAAYDTFHAQRRAEYEAFDTAYEALTEQETLIGAFTIIAD